VNDVKALLKTARESFMRVHRYATRQEGSSPYMSIPADKERDADLLHYDALDALEAHIDGEPQRIAAAIAEERRRVLEALHEANGLVDCQCDDDMTASGHSRGCKHLEVMEFIFESLTEAP
jgi:hypothetical protein